MIDNSLPLSIHRSAHQNAKHDQPLKWVIECIFTYEVRVIHDSSSMP
ncbi:Uncharacterised protein [Enterobacter hormaechei]|nr:Uncharacterised protein [Enterobacter hormaechei]